ncbi:hypothetical protein NQ318_013231 [Aromia moschata]|uniref:Uncharacterized protein n=1 Tax=Aromia moschata TaxID=1265417 RepID=A0AAV8YCJ5_9CUCU|nr:hypothetical protein NQ318_013231 [Aromia moschata]
MKAAHCKIIEEYPSLKWFCKNCLVFVDIVAHIQSELENFKKEIKNEVNTLVEGVKNRNYDESQAKSYANATKEAVVIKPKIKQGSTKTKESIKESINPVELKVGISEIRNIQEGGIIIKCDTKEEAEKIKSAANEKLSENYNINTPKSKNPCVKILDIDVELGEEDLIKNMKNQNDYLNNENVIQVLEKAKLLYNDKFYISSSNKSQAAWRIINDTVPSKKEHSNYINEIVIDNKAERIQENLNLWKEYVKMRAPITNK